MQPSQAPPLSELRDIIVAALPEHERSHLVVLNEGWDSAGVEADGEWIFKFPRRAGADVRLRKECGVLALIRPQIELAVPDMELFESPRLFSRHRKLPGRFLEPVDYRSLTETQRDGIAEQMAGLYATIHSIPKAEARAAGATAIDAWPGPAEVAECEAYLPAELAPLLGPTLDRWARLIDEPDEEVFGYFDGHGWNMAFDEVTGVLNGVYDFADSGFGLLHQDLSYSNWISRDLTLRIISRYERLTGRAIDRERVMAYSQILRFVELAEAVPDRADVPDRLRALHDWFAPER